MSIPVSTLDSVCSLQRDHFPPGFTFGAASSAFQVEGEADKFGRGPSIWDTYCTKKGLVLGKAIDHYNRYKEDVALMKWMGLDAYRFSISWSRILPTGKKSGGSNPEGIKYYKDLIDELDKNGITPFVTLFHWDVPQALEDKYGGFRDREIIEDFEDYADVCFMEFGKKVKNWITINEPWSFSEGGYATGTLAPGRGVVSGVTTSTKAEDLHPPANFSQNVDPLDTSGNPGVEPYLVTHHQLLAHAKAVKLYRAKYNQDGRGQIGMALNSIWVEPLDPKKDKEAQKRSLDFTLNWFLRPITVGKYPNNVQKVMDERSIETFSKEESNMLKGSSDFLGINYYTASYVRDAPDNVEDGERPNYTTDSKVEYPRKFHLGDDWGAVDWLKVYPQGLKEVLVYAHKKYKGPIHITENGFGEKEVESLLPHEALYDHKRVSYHHQHLRAVIQAINEHGINVKGYFAWTLWDNFEWAAGYSVRFGNVYVDFKNDLKRTPKFSAQWFKFILKKSKKKSSGLIDTQNLMAMYYIPPIDDSDDDELENKCVEEGDHREANGDFEPEVFNSDPINGSVEDPTK